MDHGGLYIHREHKGHMNRLAFAMIGSRALFLRAHYLAPVTQQNKVTWMRLLPAAVWGLAILILSLMPGGPGGLNFLGIPHFDKIGHFGMYAIWTLLIYWPLQCQPARGSGRAVWIALITGVVIGIVLEFGQYFMRQGRSFEVADMVANALGAMTGVVAGMWLFSRK